MFRRGEAVTRRLPSASSSGGAKPDSEESTSPATACLVCLMPSISRADRARAARAGRRARRAGRRTPPRRGCCRRRARPCGAPRPAPSCARRRPPATASPRESQQLAEAVGDQREHDVVDGAAELGAHRLDVGEAHVGPAPAPVRPDRAGQRGGGDRAHARAARRAPRARSPSAVASVSRGRAQRPLQRLAAGPTGSPGARASARRTSTLGGLGRRRPRAAPRGGRSCRRTSPTSGRSRRRRRPCSGGPSTAAPSARPRSPSTIHSSHSGLLRSRCWEKTRAAIWRSCSSLPGRRAARVWRRW